MIQEIENRRSIRKYKPDAVSKEILEHIIYSATLAPSAKNRQPWKFIVYQGKEKDRLVDVMRNGINSEKCTHKLMPEWAFAIPDAQNTVRIMQEAPCLGRKFTIRDINSGINQPVYLLHLRPTQCNFDLSST